jgi:hypothetical protein
MTLGVVEVSKRIAGFVGSAVVATSVALLGPPLPSASAEPCPDVEVVFARGTGEPPGVGGVGQALVDSLRSQVGDRSLGVYGVDYPASADFGNRIEFAKTVVDGVRDAGAHIQATAANCPKTRIVLGGYSQGAAVAGYVTANRIPDGVPAEYVSQIPNPLPPSVADNVAAVTLIGRPSDRFLSDVGAPPIVIGPLYADKTTEVCATDDTICNGAGVGGPSFAHALYGVNGMVGEAAAFATSRL